LTLTERTVDAVKVSELIESLGEEWMSMYGTYAGLQSVAGDSDIASLPSKSAAWALVAAPHGCLTGDHKEVLVNRVTEPGDATFVLVAAPFGSITADQCERLRQIQGGAR
jgi:hypothetical protein